MQKKLLAGQPIRLGVVGCGAVTQRAYLPLCAKMPGAQVTMLVDTNLERTVQLAKEFGVANVREDTTDLADFCDAAIVAVPHALHARVGCALLQKGVHVLVEK